MALEAENGNERGKAHGILNETKIISNTICYTIQALLLENIDNQELNNNYSKRANPFDRIQKNGNC